MKNRFIAAAFAAVAFIGTASVFAADMGNMNMGKSNSAEKVAHGVGVVKDIDTKQNTIILAHQPIKELNWSAMTMAFKVSNEKLLKGVKVGDQVSFDLKGSGMSPVVTAIRPAK
ncbi:cation transporter [Herbaspirillum sp. meg3]|uniref:copper-binding protein n=1 Tax=Herbaspirillum sp. meg3 TaxID=2025949 RepID=UPI000B9975D9|nr:copper-binding protein [Herbaspirillum sp. meg3]ASU39428.1 cation transporter [Herbaspirillum sp. meg3]